MLGPRHLSVAGLAAGLSSALLVSWITLTMRAPLSEQKVTAAASPGNPLENLTRVQEIVILQRGIEKDRQACEQLDEDMRLIRESGPAREQIVACLIEERLTLLEAAARFYEVSWASAAYRSRISSQPGHTRKEQVCRALIAYASSRLQQLPDQGKAVLARLEAQLQTYREEEGGIPLAQSASSDERSPSRIQP